MTNLSPGGISHSEHPRKHPYPSLTAEKMDSTIFQTQPSTNLNNARSMPSLKVPSNYLIKSKK